FLKKHYEKVLLSVVLLGLAVAAALLPLQASRIRGELADVLKREIQTRPKAYKVIDLNTNQAAIQRLQTSVNFEFSGQHNLFNPVQWKKTPDGRLIKIQTGSELGPGAVTVASIKPLVLRVAFEGVGGSQENPTYNISVLRQTDVNSRPILRNSKVGVKNDQFTLLEARPPSNPTEFDIKIQVEKGKEENITISKENPFTRIIGYVADLKYEPGKQNFTNKKVKDKITLEGENETYNIVAITPSEVVLSANSTQKRTTIKYSGAPAN
ncbi:MAG: hypothetical protein AB1813_28385, partial [Verrucomicrobiota bacterium]